MKITSRKLVKKGLTPAMIENLIHGHNPLVGDDPFKSEIDRRKTWKKHRGYILETFRDRRSSPDDGTYFDLTFPSGERPEAFWRYDSPGMRKILSSNPESVSDELTYGKFRFLKQYDPELKYESQFDFLKRNGLLFPGEQEDYERNLKNEKALKEESKNRVKFDNVVKFPTKENNYE